MHCIIIYQKNDGIIFVRTYKYDYGRKVGDETSMGWQILNVLYEYEGNYYQHDKYMQIIRKNIEKQSNKKKIRKAIKKVVYNSMSTQLRKLQDSIY